MLRFKFVFIFVILLYTAYAEVNRGYIDLTNIDLNNKNVELNGVWEFYPNTTYSEFKVSPNKNLYFSKVPNAWNEYLKSNYGYALYRVKIILNAKATPYLGFWLKPISNAGNVYVNGEKISSIGAFSTSAQLAEPEYKSLLAGFTNYRDTIELAIEICNYNYRVGGIMYTPVIGRLDIIRSVRLKQIILFSLLVGALLVIFIYFIGFYFTRKSYKVALMFAFMCLFGALRVASTGELILKILFDVPYEWLVKSELISLYLTIAFGLLFIDKLMQQVANKKVVKAIFIYHALLSLFTLFGSIPAISYVVPYYLITVVFVMAYALYIIFAAHSQKIDGYYINVIAFIILFALGFHDILVSQDLIESTVYLMPSGIFLFVILQSYAVTKVYSLAFEKVDLLTNALRETNKNQEKTIEQRTKELNIQAEELKNSNLVKDKIFSIVAHDLRAPIKSLQTVLDFATEDDITLEELKQYLTGIRKNVSGLNLTLENVLNWSKLQMEGASINPDLFDARLSVQTIVTFYEMMATEKGIKLDNKINDRVLIYSDKNHFEIVLRNLINNALKFSNTGSTISVCAEATANDFIAFTVTDQGVGIPANKLDTIFNPEFTYSTFGTKNEKGTGLGLQLCCEFVNLNKGNISIKSTEGVGTAITFTFPVKVG